MKTLNIAHRGGAALRSENTLAAFRNAIALGCDGAELDVHARMLQERFGLAFPRYVRQMEYGLRGL